MVSLGVIISGTVGVVIGGVINYLATKRLEERRHNRQQRTDAYRDFIAGWARPEILSGEADAQSFEIGADVIDATMRIGLYGSTEVVEAVAEFKRKKDGSENQVIQTFTHMVEEMRRDGVDTEDAELDDIAQLIFGTDMPSD